MSAQLQEPSPDLFPMSADDLAEVVAVERRLYTAPWTAGNFSDSIAAGYGAYVLRAPLKDGERDLIGYFLVMAAVDEAHLLNITVAPGWQGQGFGAFLLEQAQACAQAQRARTIILEVRPSNERALAFYRRYGFAEIGVRRGYYPDTGGDRGRREDAIVMRRELT